MLTDDNCAGAFLYLGWAHDNMVIARHVEPERREFWVREAIANLRTAALKMGFELVQQDDGK